jgi:hypothetical protein
MTNIKLIISSPRGYLVRQNAYNLRLSGKATRQIKNGITQITTNLTNHRLLLMISISETYEHHNRLGVEAKEGGG